MPKGKPTGRMIDITYAGVDYAVPEMSAGNAGTYFECKGHRFSYDKDGKFIGVDKMGTIETLFLLKSTWLKKTFS